MMYAWIAAAAVSQFGYLPQSPPVVHYLPAGGATFSSAGPHYAPSSSPIPAFTPPRWPLPYTTILGTPLPLPQGYVWGMAADRAPSRARMIVAPTEPD